MFPVAAKPAKYAFVLGIGRYRHSPLANPCNDAKAIASELRGIGFDVEDYVDLDKRNIDFRMEKFIERAGEGGTMLLYYSGHGIQLANGASLVNYIVPADFSFDVDDPLRHLVSVQDIVAAMGKARNRFIFLDACRDTAGLEATIRPGAYGATAGTIEMGGSVFSQGGTRSLATDFAYRPLRRAPISEQTVIAFSSESGSLAEDGKGELSPFTASVVRYMGSRGLDITSLLHRVNREVRASTSGRQMPWTNSNLPDHAHILESDPSPIWKMELMGAAAGLIAGPGEFSFWRDGRLQPAILADVLEQPVHLLSAVPMALTLAYGAYRWGDKTPSLKLGLLTGGTYLAVSALVRVAFAKLEPPEMLQPLYDAWGCGRFNWDRETLQLLVLGMVGSGIVGMTTILAASFYNRQLWSLPRLGLGALFGQTLLVLLLLFAWLQSVWIEFAHVGGIGCVAGSSVPDPARDFTWAILQIAFIAVIGATWIGLLGANAGWAYWTHVPLPDDRKRRRRWLPRF